MNAYSYSHPEYLHVERANDLSNSLFGNNWQNERLKNLLKAISVVVSPKSDNETFSVTEKTLSVAVDIARRIPLNREYPKVGVDDSCIFMIWEGDSSNFAVVVEGERIYRNLNPGSNSKHLEPIIYDSQYLQFNIWQYTPNRR